MCQIYYDDDQEEEKEVKEIQKMCATSAVKPLINVLSFSKWLKLIRTVTWILLFAENIRRREADLQIGELKPQELKKGERIIICLAQEECLPDKLKSLRNGSGIPSRSSVKSLNPILDTEGLLRVNGRLKLAENICEDAKNPILLPRKHHITRLIIAYHHESGVNHVLADVRTRFWIAYGREAVRSWEFQCNQCTKCKAKPAEQIMAPLPKCRLGNSMRAFERSGVDYGGPYINEQG